MTPREKQEVVSVAIRFPPELWEIITTLADKDRRSKNSQVVALIEEAIRARGVSFLTAGDPPASAAKAKGR